MRLSKFAMKKTTTQPLQYRQLLEKCSSFLWSTKDVNIFDVVVVVADECHSVSCDNLWQFNSQHISLTLLLYLLLYLKVQNFALRQPMLVQFQYLYNNITYFRTNPLQLIPLRHRQRQFQLLLLPVAANAFATYRTLLSH